MLNVHIHVMERLSELNEHYMNKQTLNEYATMAQTSSWNRPSLDVKVHAFSSTIQLIDPSPLQQAFLLPCPICPQFFLKKG